MAVEQMRRSGWSSRIFSVFHLLPEEEVATTVMPLSAVMSLPMYSRYNSLAELPPMQPMTEPPASYQSVVKLP